MSSVGSVSGSSSIWQSLKSIFDDTSSKVKSDVNAGRADAKAVLQSNINEIKSTANSNKSDVSSLRHLIDTWI